jgi:hypothetical protein
MKITVGSCVGRHLVASLWSGERKHVISLHFPSAGATLAHFMKDPFSSLLSCDALSKIYLVGGFVESLHSLVLKLTLGEY